MRIGLLWFDQNARRSPEEKLNQAAARYAERFGRSATLCHVNPDELFVHPSIRVLPDPAVQPRHFLVGRDEEEEKRPRRSRRSA